MHLAQQVGKSSAARAARAGSEKVALALAVHAARALRRWRPNSLLNQLYQWQSFSLRPSHYHPQSGKSYAARAARAGSKKEALATADEGFAVLEALFNKSGAAIDELVGVARALRRLPLVDPFLPTVSAPLTWILSRKQPKRIRCS